MASCLFGAKQSSEPLMTIAKNSAFTLSVGIQRLNLGTSRLDKSDISKDPAQIKEPWGLENLVKFRLCNISHAEDVAIVCCCMNHVIGLMQDCSISIANTLEILH